MVTIKAVVPAIAGGIITPSVLLAGMISFHPIVCAERITRTAYIDNGAAGLQTINIPAFAKSLVFLKGNNTEYAKAAVLEFNDSSGLPIGYVISAASTVFVDPIEIPNGAVAVVIGTAAAASVWGTVIFNLAL